MLGGLRRSLARYFVAKLVIHLVHRVADVVNGDAKAREWMRVAFVPDYKVSVAEVIIPAADLSEQISVAGTEASGTGCMTFALNGALTIGTLDGANLEMSKAIGLDNLYTFGSSAEEAARLLTDGPYDPRTFFETRPATRCVVEALTDGRFSGGDRALFEPLVGRLLHSRDPFFHLADLEAYSATRQLAAEDFRRCEDWSRRAILTIARMGWFSSDRSIREYAAGTWNLKAVSTETPSGRFGPSRRSMVPLLAWTCIVRGWPQLTKSSRLCSKSKRLYDRLTKLSSAMRGPVRWSCTAPTTLRGSGRCVASDDTVNCPSALSSPLFTAAPIRAAGTPFPITSPMKEMGPSPMCGKRGGVVE